MEWLRCRTRQVEVKMSRYANRRLIAFKLSWRVWRRRLKTGAIPTRKPADVHSPCLAWPGLALVRVSSSLFGSDVSCFRNALRTGACLRVVVTVWLPALTRLYSVGPPALNSRPENTTKHSTPVYINASHVASSSAYATSSALRLRISRGSLGAERKKAASCC